MASEALSARASAPIWLRGLGLAWLLVYLPAYQIAYGWSNFLFLCNLGVMITALALLIDQRLLLSSQAVAAPVIGLAWGLDAGFRVLTGDFLFGGTAYMWNPEFPLFTRLLSLYHLFWPLLLLWWVRRFGYDRRGWAVQTVIAALGIGLSRALTPADQNVNFAWADPFFGRQLGPAWAHLLIVVAALAGVAYGLTHWALTRWAPEPRPQPTERSKRSAIA